MVHKVWKVSFVFKRTFTEAIPASPNTTTRFRLCALFKMACGCTWLLRNTCILRNWYEKKNDKYNPFCLGDLQKGILRLCGSNPGVGEQHSGQMLIQFATWTNLNWYKYDHSIKWLPGSGHPRRGLYWHNAFITRLVLTHLMERLRKDNIATETSGTFHSDQNTLKHNLVT